MDTHSGEGRIDELLNGYIDDELATRQRTEVERLIAHDAKIERRLQQLQKCRTLVGSLPCAEAPPQVLEAVKASLASTAAIYEQTSYGRRMGKIHLLGRRMLSAAAMLALVGLLAAVVYTIVAPNTPSDGPPVAVDRPPSMIVEPAEPTAVSPALAFSGRLELTTSIPAEIGAVIKTTIEENGLSDSVGDVRESGKHIHYVRCSKQGLNSLLAALENVWPRLDSAKMLIDTEVFGKEVAVDAVTTGQIAEIIDGDSQEKRIELARDFDLLNTTAASIPGANVLSPIEAETANLMTIPKPLIVGPSVQKAPDEAEADKTIRLTIILSR